MMEPTKINNSAIILPIKPLLKRTMCNDNHYSHQPRHPHPTGKAIDIMGYIMYVWYQTVPEKNPGMYLRIYVNGFSNYINSVLIDNATNITSFVVDTTKDKTLITVISGDIASPHIKKKWIYIDFNTQVMHKEEWGEKKDVLYVSSFIDENKFVLYEKKAFYKYEVYNNYYLMTSSSYSGPDIKFFVYDSNQIGKAIYTQDNIWYLAIIDTKGSFINKQFLAPSDDYKISRGTKVNNSIVYGYDFNTRKFNIYHDPSCLNKTYTIHYDLHEDTREISMNLYSAERISLLEISKQVSRKTILTLNGTIIAIFDIDHVMPGTIEAITHSGYFRAKEEDFYEKKELLTDFHFGTIPVLVREMIASRLANLINSNIFPKKYYVREENNLARIGYINPYRDYMRIACNNKDITTLYAVASVLGMPFLLEGIKCYNAEEDMSQSQLYWTDFHRAAEYSSGGYSIETALKYLPKHKTLKWIVPKIAYDCGDLLQCDSVELKNIYQYIYNEISFRFIDIFDSVACAIVSENFDTSGKEIVKYSVFDQAEISADNIRRVVEHNINEIGKLLENSEVSDSIIDL